MVNLVPRSLCILQRDRGFYYAQLAARKVAFGTACARRMCKAHSILYKSSLKAEIDGLPAGHSNYAFETTTEMRK